MKRIAIVACVMIYTLTNFSFAQEDESWKKETSWISKENAKKAKDILSNHKLIMFNDHCENGWGAIAVSTLKKVKIKEYSTGESNYHVNVTVHQGNGDKLERSIHLDWIKIETSEGVWENLAKVMGMKGDFCRE
jgi:hypothetical protein